MIEIEKYIDDKGLFDGRYLLLRQLSVAGGTADVWLAEDKDTEDEKLSDENGDEIIKIEGSAVLVAIKIYRPKNILDAEGIQTFKKEYKTVYNCHHENLLKPTGFSIIDGSIPYLIMPYCEKGSAEKLVGKLSDKDDIWKFIFDTASGLAYLHSNKPPIIHQDIKPANILIDDNNNYCITDFGISVKSGKDNEYYLDEENAGTIIYMPPERFLDEYEAEAKSDIWSFGATLFELITGDVPFGDDGGKAQNNGMAIPKIQKEIPKEIKKIISACLDKDPCKRPTANELIDIATDYSYKKKRHFGSWLFMLILFVFASIPIIIFWGYNSNSPQRDFLDIFEGKTWVFDHPEANIWEEWYVPISNVVYYSYSYSHIKQKTVHMVKALPIFSDNVLTIAPDSMPPVSGIISKYEEYEFTWKLDLGPFTYHCVIGKDSLLIGTRYTPKYSQLLTDSANIRILGFKSHRPDIAEVNSNGEIYLKKEGRTYVDVKTTKGTALIQVASIE